MRKPDGSQVELVREFGFNDYRKTGDIDFQPAYTYRGATGGYWARVRARWDALLAKAPGVHVKTKIDGMAMIIPLFEQAGELEKGTTVADASIDEVFIKWVEAAPAEAVAVRSAR